MKRKSSLRPLLIIFLSLEDCISDAWIYSLETTIRSRPRLSWDGPPASSRRQRKSNGYRGRSEESCSFLRQNRDDNLGADLEEEEYYRNYENAYSPNRPANDDNTSSDENIFDTEKLLSIRNRQQQPQGDVPSRPTTVSKNRKVEVAKAWDEALIQRNIKTSDTTDGNNDGRTEISNISDLQRKLQQIQKRNKKGPIKGYSSEQLDIDNVLPSEWQDSISDAKGEQLGTADVTNNDQYLSILQMAQERLSEMTNSNAESSASKLSATSEQQFKARYLDNETLAELNDLEKQLKKESQQNASEKQSLDPFIKEEAKEEVFSADEAVILDALRAQSGGSIVDSSENDMDVDSRSNSRINNLNDGDDSLNPDAIPSNYKKFVSEYELTDGGVFLSPEAYQEACRNANPDGSLNFGLGEKDNQQQSPTLEGVSVNDEPPMAPYKNERGNGKEVSIEDLTEEVYRSLEFARNNPEAQEELHSRLMAEFEAEEATNDEFENEALLDPEKAIQFWNKEYFEEQKGEVDALEELLDQKMRELKKEEEGKDGFRNSESQPGRKIETQKSEYGDDRETFFASKKERIDRKMMMERNRRERARNIAEFYEGLGENSSWDSTSESKEIEEITKSQKVSQTKNVDSSKNETPEETIQDNSKNSIPNNNNRSGFPGANQPREGENEWVLVEDPESPDDAFYWNEATNEMRWDPPDGW